MGDGEVGQSTACSMTSSMSVSVTTGSRPSSGALVRCGDAGIGKSALCAWAVAQAADTTRRPPLAPGPSYYALLLFARFAQGTTGLRPVTVDGAVPVTAWQVRASGSKRRLFLINKGAAPVTVDVRAPAARVDVDRMTPYDPTGAGRTLEAPDVRVDGQAVAPDGTFPGVVPTTAKTHGGHLPVAIAPGEAIVVTLHDH